MSFCAILREVNVRGRAIIPPRTTAKKSTKPAVKASVKTTAKAAKPAVKAKAKPAAKSVAKKAAPAATKKAAAAKKPAAAPKKLTGSAALAKQIATILDTNKGEDIITLALADKCSFADYMIVASGRAPRHVVALADYVGDMLKKQGIPPLSIEGKETGDWVLIDAGDIVVHIFRPEIRQFYNIEKMWAIPPATR
jgi:ribosome-associated protein